MLVVEQEEAMQRFARRQIRQAHSVEAAVPCRAAEEQPAQGILPSMALLRAGLAQLEQRSDRRRRAFFATTLQP